ncbi:MAG: CHAT domain-containing protein [Bacteroidetes bacterium]|nr:MAG: CHAT domain-containing protein [Bacteroidota bacterium]
MKTIFQCLLFAILSIFIQKITYAQSQKLDENYAEYEKIYLDQGDSSLYFYRFSKNMFDDENYEKAVFYCKKALFFAEKHYLEDCKYVNLVNISQDLTRLYMTIHRYSESLYIAEKFLTYTENLNPSCQADQDKINWNIAIYLNNMAYLFRSLHDYSKAENCIEKCLNFYQKKIGIKNGNYAILLNTAGLIQYDQKNYSKALQHYKEAYTLIKTDDPFALKEHLEHNLAGALQGLGEHERAKKMNWNAYQSTQEIFSLHNLGVILLEQPHINDKQYPEAEWCFEKVSKQGFLTLQNSAYKNLAIIFAKKNRLKEAHQAYFQSVKGAEKELKRNFIGNTEQQQLKFLQFQQKNFFFLFYEYASHYLADSSICSNLYNLSLGIKSSILYEFLEVQKNIANGDNDEIKALFEEWKSLNQSLEKITDSISKQKYLEKSEKIKADLVYKSADFKQYQTSVRWQDVQKKLKANELAIEIIAYEYKSKKYYLALLLRSKGNPIAIQLPPDLDQLTDKFHQSVETDFVEGYADFWQIFEPYLKNIENIYFSPDGAYNLINLNILQHPKTKTFLGDQFRIYLLNSTKELLASTKKYNDQTALLFGNPDFNADLGDLAYLLKHRGTLCDLDIRSINALPNTQKEIDQIQKILSNSFKSQILNRQEANKYNLLQISKSKNPRILHLATHGAFCENNNEHPLFNSFLALSGLANSPNEKLSAYEILQMDLKKTEMVVLSACETGKGKIANGEGVLGMSRAFKSAGVRNTVMSLWKVDDQATQLLMQYFYEFWIKKQDLHAALLQAQNRFRKEFPETSPQYWGAFVIWGL